MSTFFCCAKIDSAMSQWLQNIKIDVPLLITLETFNVHCTAHYTADSEHFFLRQTGALFFLLKKGFVALHRMAGEMLLANIGNRQIMSNVE